MASKYVFPFLCYCDENTKIMVKFKAKEKIIVAFKTLIQIKTALLNDMYPKSWTKEEGYFLCQNLH